MQKAPIPPDESTRLAALKELHLLDSSPEERFDRLTRLAKAIFEVPIALVTLVDEDRQWFKSKMGLEVDETPRDISFCGHVIAGDGLFIVTDSEADPRFADNPLVTGEPHVRFYAGEPLKTSDGSKIGTLCVIDHKPRKITASQLKLLKDLAEMAESEIAATELATTDFLTQIVNRRGFNLLSQKSMNVCKRMQRPAALAFIDLDKLKTINDEHGYSQGDLALQDFANAMEKTFRVADVYGRWGGDEFVVWMSDATVKMAEDAMSRLREQCEIANKHLGRSYKLSFSAGICAVDLEKDLFLSDVIVRAEKIMSNARKAKFQVKPIKS